MKRKIWGVVLALSMFAAFVPTMASAETGTKYGDYLYYEINADNTAVTITDCEETATEIEIPTEIEGVPVTVIGEYAFCDCSSLTSVTIGNSVTSIGDIAFAGCYSLTSITIPDSVTSIGASAFADCRITSITIPDNVTTIDEGAFRGCENLTSITIPDGVTSIGVNTFYGCRRLTSITIPDSVTGIVRGAFLNTAYYDDEANWENGVLYIGNHLIEADYDKISSEYTIKNGTKTIADRAFYGCRRLTSITIPDSVTNIGEGAFLYCSSLTSITIPDSVTSVGEGAFADCDMLTDVYYLGTEKQWKAISVGEDNEVLLNATIHYSGDTPATPTPNPDIVDTTVDTYETGEITPTENGVTFTVTTKESVSGKQTVIVACYDENGVFVGLEWQEITASDEAQTISVEIDKEHTSMVKAFIWNAMGYMAPASRPQSLEL